MLVTLIFIVQIIELIIEFHCLYFGGRMCSRRIQELPNPIDNQVFMSMF